MKDGIGSTPHPCLRVDDGVACSPGPAIHALYTHESVDARHEAGMTTMTDMPDDKAAHRGRKFRGKRLKTSLPRPEAETPLPAQGRRAHRQGDRAGRARLAPRGRGLDRGGPRVGERRGDPSPALNVDAERTASPSTASRCRSASARGCSCSTSRAASSPPAPTRTAARPSSARCRRTCRALSRVGRLDMNTEGLLLLTNDGGLARALELPATGWLRRYRVRAYGKVLQHRLDGLRNGITVDGIRYGAIEATLDREQGDNVWITFAMREGKNREIRNVLGELGLKVNRLIRLSYGPFQLGDLPAGAVEEVKTRHAARAARRAACGDGRARIFPGRSWSGRLKPRRKDCCPVSLRRAKRVRPSRARRRADGADRSERQRPRASARCPTNGIVAVHPSRPGCAGHLDDGERTKSAEARGSDERRGLRSEAGAEEPSAAPSKGDGESRNRRQASRQASRRTIIRASNEQPRIAGRVAGRDRSPGSTSNRKPGGRADADRRRQARRAHAARAEIAGDPADLRPAARGAVQHPPAFLRRSGRAARACSTCSPAPARWASRRCRAARPSCCSSTTARRRARCCAAMSMRWARAARARSIAATPPGSGRCAPLAPFSLAFLDPPYGKGLAEQALGVGARRRMAHAGCVDRRRGGGGRGFRAPEGFEEIERRDYGDTQLRSCERVSRAAEGAKR